MHRPTSSSMSQETLSLNAIILTLLLLIICQLSHAIQTSDDTLIDPDLQCQPLIYEPCSNFGYTSVRMPNVFGHPNQEDAKTTAIELLILNKTQCSDEYVFYICQMLFPLCLTKGAHNYDKPVLPCRSMCNRVYDSCKKSIIEARHILKNDWPQQLECDNLEVENPDSGICHDPHYELYKTTKQHKESQQQSSKSNNNNNNRHQQNNKTKPNSQSSDSGSSIFESSDPSNSDDGWDTVRQPFEPPKHPVDANRDTSPLDISRLINPQTTHSTPSNRFSNPKSVSTASIDPSLDQNLDRFNRRPPIIVNKNNQPAINNVQPGNTGEFPAVDGGNPPYDEINNQYKPFDHNLSSVVGTQCDCSCRAPLVPIVDILDRRYHNRVRVGYQINCAYPCSVKYRNQRKHYQASSPINNHRYHLQNSMNIFLTAREQQTLNTVVTVLAWSCLTLTGLALITFLSDIYRFKYPTRCIVFLCACYLLVSSGYLLRSPMVDTSTTNDISSSDSVEELSSNLLPPAVSALQTILDQQQQPFYCYQNLARYPGSGTVQLRCLATFFLTYFFMMAANVWWIIFAIVSFMSSLGWAQESLSNYSQCFHLIAWLVPLIISIVILATEAIDADIQLSMCSVGNLDMGNLQAYIIIPQIAALAIGFLFVATQFVSLIRRRNLIRLKNPCDKSSSVSSSSSSSAGASPPSSTQISPTGYLNDESYQGKSSISKQALTVNVAQSGNYVTTATTTEQDSCQLRYLEKLDGSILRIVLFCLLYFIPMLTLVACLLYEQYSRPIRERQYVCPCLVANQSATTTSSFGQYLLSNVGLYETLLAKHISILSVGITSSLWLCFNLKTLKQWRKVVRTLFRCCCDTNNESYTESLDYDVGAIYNNNANILHEHQNKQNYQKQQHLLQKRSIFLPADKNSTIASSRSLVRDNILVSGSQQQHQQQQQQNNASYHNHRQLQLLQQQRGDFDLTDLNHHTTLMSSDNGSTIVGSTINQYDEINTLGHSNQMNLSSKQQPYNYRLASTSTASTSRIDAMSANHTNNVHKQPQYPWMSSGASQQHNQHHNLHQHHHQHSGSQSSSIRGYAPSSSINKDFVGHSSRRD